MNDSGSFHYRYDGLEFLNQIITDIPSNRFQCFYLCVYHVHIGSHVPFLQYMLCHNVVTNKLQFPSYIHTEDSTDGYQLIEDIKNYLLSLMKREGMIELLCNEDDFKKKDEELKIQMKYSGFMEYNGDIYLFIDISHCKEEFYRTNEFSCIQFGLMDEIVNTNMIAGRKMDSDLVKFFIKNKEFIYLKNEEGVEYELPSAAYSCVPRNKLPFTSMFGISTDTDGPLGNYYYFTDYVNARRMAHTRTKETGIPHGIIRVGLLNGLSKVLIEDIVNVESTQDYENEIGDQYDSYFYLKNNTIPTYVVKRFQQQIPLEIVS